MEHCPLCTPQSECVLLQTENFRIIAVENEKHQPALCRVIWQNHVAEMSDLSLSERTEFMEAVFAVELAMRQVLKPSKMNLASLGNMVPHLHWHIIARFENDECFPAPVWAAPIRTADYQLPENWMTQVQTILENHYAR